MKRVSYKPSLREQRKREAIFRAYDRLPQHKKDRIDEMANNLRETVRMRGKHAFGFQAAIELFGKLGMYDKEVEPLWETLPTKPTVSVQKQNT